MSEEYLMVIGESDKFTEYCKLPYSELVDLTAVGADDLEVEIGVGMLYVVGSFKTKESFIKAFDESPLTYAEILFGDLDDYDEEMFFRSCLFIGGVLHMTKLKEGVSHDVFLAKAKGFPEHYTSAEVALKTRGGEIKKFSEGSVVGLDPKIVGSSILDYYIFGDGDPKPIPDEELTLLFKGSRYQIYDSHDNRERKLTDRFKIYRRNDKKPKLVPVN